MGAAIARELAATGHRVALMSPSGSAVALGDELGGFGIQPVTEEADINRLVQETVARYGRIDAVVNNTGTRRRAICWRSPTTTGTRGLT